MKNKLIKYPLFIISFSHRKHAEKFVANLGLKFTEKNVYKLSRK